MCKELRGLQKIEVIQFEMGKITPSNVSQKRNTISKYIKNKNKKQKPTKTEQKHSVFLTIREIQIV